MLVTGTRLNQHGNVAALTALVTMPNGSSTRNTYQQVRIHLRQCHHLELSETHTMKSTPVRATKPGS